MPRHDHAQSAILAPPPGGQDGPRDTAPDGRVSPRAAESSGGANLRYCLGRALPILAVLVLVAPPSLCAQGSAIRFEIDAFRQVKTRPDGTRQFELRSAAAEVNGDSVRLRDVAVRLFDQQEREVLTAKTPACVYERSSRVCRGDSSIHATSGQYALSGKGFLLDTQEQTLRIHSQVKMTVCFPNEPPASPDASGETGRNR